MLYEDNYEYYKLEIFGVDRSVYYYPFLCKTSTSVEKLEQLKDTLIRFLAFSECFIPNVEDTKRYISHIDLYRIVNVSNNTNDTLMTPIYNKFIIYHSGNDYRLRTNIDFYKKYNPELVPFLESIEEFRNSDAMKKIIFGLRLFEFEYMASTKFKNVDYLLYGRVDDSDE